MNYCLPRISLVRIGEIIKMVFSLVFGIAVLSGCSAPLNLSSEQKAAVMVVAAYSSPKVPGVHVLELENRSRRVNVKGFSMEIKGQVVNVPEIGWMNYLVPLSFARRFETLDGVWFRKTIRFMVVKKSCPYYQMIFELHNKDAFQRNEYLASCAKGPLAVSFLPTPIYRDGDVLIVEPGLFDHCPLRMIDTETPEAKIDHAVIETLEADDACNFRLVGVKELSSETIAEWRAIIKKHRKEEDVQRIAVERELRREPCGLSSSFRVGKVYTLMGREGGFAFELKNESEKISNCIESLVADIGIVDANGRQITAGRLSLTNLYLLSKGVVRLPLDPYAIHPLPSNANECVIAIISGRGDTVEESVSKGEHLEISDGNRSGGEKDAPKGGEYSEISGKRKIRKSARIISSYEYSDISDKIKAYDGALSLKVRSCKFYKPIDVSEENR